MAEEFFHDQIFMKECAGRGDRTRGRLHGKRSDLATAPGYSKVLSQLSVALFLW